MFQNKHCWVLLDDVCWTMHEVIMFFEQAFSIQPQGILLPQILKPNNSFIFNCWWGKIEGCAYWVLGFSSGNKLAWVYFIHIYVNNSKYLLMVDFSFFKNKKSFSFCDFRDFISTILWFWKFRVCLFHFFALLFHYNMGFFFVLFLFLFVLIYVFVCHIFCN